MAPIPPSNTHKVPNSNLGLFNLLHDQLKAQNHPLADTPPYTYHNALSLSALTNVKLDLLNELGFAEVGNKFISPARRPTTYIRVKFPVNNQEDDVSEVKLMPPPPSCRQEDKGSIVDTPGTRKRVRPWNESNEAKRRSIVFRDPIINEEDDDDDEDFVFKSSTDRLIDDYHTLRLFVYLKARGKEFPQFEFDTKRCLRKERELELRYKRFVQDPFTWSFFNSQMGYAMFEMSRYIWGSTMRPRHDGSGSTTAAADDDDDGLWFDQSDSYYHPYLLCSPCDYDPPSEPEAEPEPDDHSVVNMADKPVVDFQTKLAVGENDEPPKKRQKQMGDIKMKGPMKGPMKVALQEEEEENKGLLLGYTKSEGEDDRDVLMFLIDYALSGRDIATWSDSALTEFINGIVDDRYKITEDQFAEKVVALHGKYMDNLNMYGNGDSPYGIGEDKFGTDLDYDIFAMSRSLWGGVDEDDDEDDGYGSDSYGFVNW